MDSVMLVPRRLRVISASGDAVAIWRQFMQMDPQEFLATLSSGMDGIEASAEFTFDQLQSNVPFPSEPGLPGGNPPNRLDLLVKMVWTRPRRFLGIRFDRTKVMTSIAGVHFDTGTVVGMSTDVPKDFQGAGVGRMGALNRLCCWRRIGARRAIGMMGKDVGGYVWARMGYRLGTGSEDDIRRFVSRQIESSKVRQCVSVDILDQARAIVREGGADMPYKLANLSGPRIGDESLGSSLLRYSKWCGEFDLRQNSVSWNRAEIYGRGGH